MSKLSSDEIQAIIDEYEASLKPVKAEKKPITRKESNSIASNRLNKTNKERSEKVFLNYIEAMRNDDVGDDVIHNLKLFGKRLYHMHFSDKLYNAAAQEIAQNFDKFKVYYTTHVLFAAKYPAEYKYVKDSITLPVESSYVDVVKSRLNRYRIKSYSPYVDVVKSYENPHYKELFDYVSYVYSRLDEDMKEKFLSVSTGFMDYFNALMKLDFLASEDGKKFITYLKNRRY